MYLFFQKESFSIAKIYSWLRKKNAYELGKAQKDLNLRTKQIQSLERIKTAMKYIYLVVILALSIPQKTFVSK